MKQLTLRRALKIGAGALFLCTALYAVFADHLPPRTAVKVVRIVSRLPIPSDATVLRFADQWNDFNGDGFTEVLLQLDERSMATVAAQAREHHYASLSELGESQEFVRAQFLDKVEGLFKLTRPGPEGDYSIAIIDTISRQIRARIAVQ